MGYLLGDVESARPRAGVLPVAAESLAQNRVVRLLQTLKLINVRLNYGVN